MSSRSLGAPVRFGRYLLLSPIGRGGMAEVFRALPTGAIHLDSAVALKRVRADLDDTPGILQMFVDEARIAARLDHPNLGRILEFGCEGHVYYQTMEYLPGVDLHDVLRGEEQRFALPPELAAYIGLQLAEGLEHAHRLSDEDGQPMSIVHRDVNPRNIRLTFDGRVTLLDFGIARSRHRLTRTDTGMVKGKLAYLAPEQLEKGSVLDGRTDLFALGITLYEMTTGRHPFSHRDVQHMFTRIKEGAYVPPQELAPDAPPALCAIIDRALAPDREERWQTAGEIAFELGRVLRRCRPRPDAETIAALVQESFPARYHAALEADRRLESLIGKVALGEVGVEEWREEADSIERAVVLEEEAPEELTAESALVSVVPSVELDLSELEPRAEVFSASTAVFRGPLPVDAFQPREVVTVQRDLAALARNGEPRELTDLGLELFDRSEEWPAWRMESGRSGTWIELGAREAPSFPAADWCIELPGARLILSS